MDKGASRRIRRAGPEKSPGPDYKQNEGKKGPPLSLILLASMAIHALVLGFLGYFPGTEERRRDAEIYSVSLTPLPSGPAGGGGESTEAVKPLEEPKKAAVPEKDAVKLASKTVEKPLPEPEKEPEAAEPVPVAVEAPKGPGQGPVGGGSGREIVHGPITLEGGVEFPFGYYLDAIQKKIERLWDPPKLWAKKAPKVVVFFRVDRAGRVADVELELGSGVDLYDQKAILAVKKSAPLPPLPAGFHGDRLGVHYIFVPEG